MNFKYNKKLFIYLLNQNEFDMFDSSNRIWYNNFQCYTNKNIMLA